MRSVIFNVPAGDLYRAYPGLVVEDIGHCAPTAKAVATFSRCGRRALGLVCCSGVNELPDLARRSYDLLANVLQRFWSNAEPPPVGIVQNGDEENYQSE
jgi:hypothetical protein